MVDIGQGPRPLKHKLAPDVRGPARSEEPWGRHRPGAAPLGGEVARDRPPYPTGVGAPGHDSLHVAPARPQRPMGHPASAMSVLQSGSASSALDPDRFLLQRCE
eukprot:13603828-Alexandrium_andersonii.AAC.1